MTEFKKYKSVKTSFLKGASLPNGTLFMLKVNSNDISEIIESENFIKQFMSDIEPELIDEFYNFSFGKRSLLTEKTHYDKHIFFDKIIKNIEMRILIMGNGNEYVIFS
jgi:hypothetical protein